MDLKLVDDIEAHGVLEPVVIRRDGTVKDGVKRIVAAIQVGLSIVPVVFED